MICRGACVLVEEGDGDHLGYVCLSLYFPSGHVVYGWMVTTVALLEDVQFDWLTDTINSETDPEWVYPPGTAPFELEADLGGTTVSARVYPDGKVYLREPGDSWRWHGQGYVTRLWNQPPLLVMGDLAR